VERVEAQRLSGNDKTKRKDTAMKKALTVLILVLSFGPLAIAGTAHPSQVDEPGSHSATKKSGVTGNTFTHQAVVEGVRAEFQLMSLASMNMEDPEGNTHHVMIKFFDESSQNQIKDGIGKVTLIGPSGRERVETLKNYNGIFAAKLTFAERGRYGVICLFEVDGKERLFKFWYPHG
jgi:hypothetical protein